MPTKPIPTLMLTLGAASADYAAALEKAASDKLVERLWARDHTLWAPAPDEISNRLGWLDIMARMETELPALRDFASDIKDAGIQDVLLLGMGGSSLAPEVFSKVFGPAPGFPNLHVLDSTDPQAVNNYADSLDPAGTLYIVSTKSGGTVETFSFFKFFYNLAEGKLGDQVGQHFVAITDPGSKLASQAEEYKFRRTFLNDPDIGGRYSALSFFGLVPAALLGLDLDELLSRAEAMCSVCQNQDVYTNQGVQLGLVLASLAKAGRDKLSFRIPERIASFGDWVEQLIAESTGKSGTGILPVVHEPPAPTKSYGDDRAFVAVELQDEGSHAELQSQANAGEPIISLRWPDRYALGAHFFLWEFATAVAGYGLGINPFDQPNVESAKVLARNLAEEYSNSGKLPKGDAQPLDPAALKAFLADAPTDAYISLQAYLPPTETTTVALQKLRGKLLRYRMATTLGFGPRFLHSTGQLHKGDAGKGLFVQLLSATNEDVDIPDEIGSSASEISFGALKAVQALGDAQALRDAGRRVIRFDLSSRPTAEIENLARQLP
jgi:glucose-6-phosphate isomerase